MKSCDQSRDVREGQVGTAQTAVTFDRFVLRDGRQVGGCGGCQKFGREANFKSKSSKERAAPGFLAVFEIRMFKKCKRLRRKVYVKVKIVF